MWSVLDKTDIVLCQLFLGNSRLSCRELAEKLDLSATAVHDRIQTLIDIGIIRKFTSKISKFAQNDIHLLFFGNFKNTSITSVKQKLEQNNGVCWLAVGGGNVLYAKYYKILSFKQEKA